nr:Hpt domain-containing protein [uncultured Anaerotignum sp.]
MTVSEFYQAVAGDYADACSRFQNDETIKRFLKMLPKDNSMELLTEAMQNAETQQAFRGAHTLKGIALNLSLTALANACSAMTELLHGSTALPAEATAAYDAVSREYAKVIKALEALDA